jgi:demethylmenaquinone methyltransferase/2-methoxy-6-polyprenyl-1,4-benzoquinol methylase
LIEPSETSSYKQIAFLFYILAPLYDLGVKVITFNSISKLKRLIASRSVTSSSDVVLDVATGTGLIAVELSKIAREVYGVDLSKAMLKMALRKSREAKSENLYLTIADAEHLPFRSEVFSASTCSFSMHHFQRPVKAFKEIFRTIKPHGRIVFLDTLNSDSFISKIIFALYWIFIELGTSRHLTIPEWRSLFRKMELTDIRIEIFGLFLLISGEKTLSH